MHIGVKHDGFWWDEKLYPSIANVNLLIDPTEKMTPNSEECGSVGR